MKRTILFATSILLILSACSSSRPIPSTTATITASPPKGFITSTPNPSKTPHIFSTPIPTFQILLTLTDPAPTIRANATLQVMAQEYSYRYPVPPYNCNATRLSPNGEWAIFEWAGNIEIIGINKTARWKLDSSVVFDEFSKEFGIKWISFEINHWSKDGKYLYFSPCPLADGIEGRKLFRFNLETGEVIETPFSSDGVFSRDDQFIVYRDDKNIVIRNLQSENKQSKSFSGTIYDKIGWFVWSPDGTQITFTTLKYFEERKFVFLDQYSVYLISLKDLSVRPLIEKHAVYQGYYTISWIEPNLIRLRRFDGENYAVFNLEENRLYLLSFITPTP